MRADLWVGRGCGVVEGAVGGVGGIRREYVVGQEKKDAQEGMKERLREGEYGGGNNGERCDKDRDERGERVEK